MILEPEEYERARSEYWQLHDSAIPGEVNQWILFSLIIKQLRQQNELFSAIKDKLESIDDTLITLLNPSGRNNP